MRKKHRQGKTLLSKLFILFSFLSFSFASLAQTVTGTVTDVGNKPISNVTVLVKGSSRSALTNDAGQFSIAAAGTDILVFTHVSFETREVAINSRESISVTLAVFTGRSDL